MIGIGELVGTNLAVIAALLFLLWALSLALKDASIVDPFWGTGFVVIAWVTFIVLGKRPEPDRGRLLVGLTTLWGARLSLYLAWRNFGKGEDYRYRAMRARHGPRFPLVSLYTVFGLQGLLMWIISMPVQLGQALGNRSPLGWLDAVGAGLCLVGIGFETVGDWQLARFKGDPANQGKVMDRGLWAYTRHPNYFGDFCVWWGLYLVAAAGGAGWTIFSPILMSLLLLRVSGVALLEKTITERRPDYAAYRARTNAFFPGPRRSAP